MLVLEKLKVKAQKTKQLMYINTLTPNLKYTSKNGKVVNLDNCCVKM